MRTRHCTAQRAALLQDDHSARRQRIEMKEHEYIKVIDRVHITSAIEQLNKVRPATSIGGIGADELESMILRLREWEEELFRVVDVDPDSS